METPEEAEAQRRKLWLEKKLKDQEAEERRERRSHGERRQVSMEDRRTNAGVLSHGPDVYSEFFI